MRSSTVAVDFAALGGDDFDPDQSEARFAQRVRLGLLGVPVTAVQDRVDLHPAGGYTWSGHIDGARDSAVTLAVRDGSLSGRVRRGSAIFEISPLADGAHLVTELTGAGLSSDTLSIPFVGASGPRSAETTDDRVDLLLLYTPQVEADLGGEAATRLFFQMAVASLNSRLRQTGTSAEVNLAAATIVDYAESNDLNRTLGQLQASSDGYLDDVHYLLRDAHGADLVHLVVGDAMPSDCGAAYRDVAGASEFADRAFSVSELRCFGVTDAFARTVAMSSGGDQGGSSPTAVAANAGGYRPSAVGVARTGVPALIDAANDVYRWEHDPSATWYYLAFEGATRTAKRWYSADGVCSGGTCSVVSPLSGGEADDHLWYLRGWNERGNGPWSAPMSVAPAPTHGDTLELTPRRAWQSADIERLRPDDEGAPDDGLVEEPVGAAAAGPTRTASALLTDRSPRVPPNYTSMSPPALGGSYVDPVFGTTITRVSDATRLSEQGVVPEYSQTSAFNRDDSYMMLYWVVSGGTVVYDTNGNNLGDVPGHDGRWSRINRNYLYYRNGNTIGRYDVATRQSTTVATFPQYNSIHFGGGQGDLSDNDRIVVVGDNRYISIYDVAARRQYGVLDTNQSPINGQSFDFATIAKDGNSFVVGYHGSGTGRAAGIEQYDLNGNFVAQLVTIAAHLAMGRDVDGSPVLYFTNAATNPQQPAGCDNGVVKVSLDGRATQSCILALPWGMGKHFSGHGSDGWVYVSTYQPTARPIAAAPGETDRTKWLAFTNEVFRVRGDGSVVERLAHHRSSVNGYWQQPHATVSISGRKVVFGSDFNRSGLGQHYADAYVIDVEGGGSPPPPPSDDGGGGGGGGGGSDVPSAPSNLTATAMSSNRVDLSWRDNANDETSFKLQRQAAGGSWNTIAWPMANATSFSDTTVSGGSWCYRIRSHRQGTTFSQYTSSSCVTIGGGGGGNSTRGSDSDVPSAPSNLTATAVSSKRVDLSWRDNADDETSFKLQRQAAGGNWNTIAWPLANSTSYTDTSVSDGSWCYRIRSHRQGTTFSLYTSSSCATVSGGGGGGGNDGGGGGSSNVSAPSNLTATPMSSNRVALSWRDNSDETSFKLQRARSGGSWSTIAWPRANTTSLIDAGVPAGTWCYRIRSHRRGRNFSAYVTSGCVTVSDDGGRSVSSPDLPAAPSNLTATPVSSNRVALSWRDNAADETSFKLQRARSGGTWSTIAWPQANTTSFADAGLSAGTWCYRIRSHRNGLHYSNYVSSTPSCVSVGGSGGSGGSTSSGPSNLRATATSYDRVRLTWNDNSNNETSFELQRRLAGGVWATIARPGANTTSFADTGLWETEFCYRIRSRHSDGSASTYVGSTPSCVSTVVGTETLPD